MKAREPERRNFPSAIGLDQRIAHEPSEGELMLTKVLAIYSSVVTTVLTAFVLAGSVGAQTQSFDEINVRRINVREPDGTLRLVISNRARLPGVIERGKEHPPGDPPPGGLGVSHRTG